MKLVSKMCLIAGLLCGPVGAEDPAAVRITPVAPQEGVFLTYSAHDTVLELKDGEFRYWFRSDAGRLVEPEYPLRGKYAVAGDKITLEHAEVFQKEWTFREVEGVVTLWRADAIKMHDEGKFFRDQIPGGLASFRETGAGSVLVRVERGPEVAWAQHVFSAYLEVVASVEEIRHADFTPSKTVTLLMTVHAPANWADLKFALVTRSKDRAKVREKYPVGITHKVVCPASYREQFEVQLAGKRESEEQIDGGIPPEELAAVQVLPQIPLVDLNAPPERFAYYPEE